MDNLIREIELLLSIDEDIAETVKNIKQAKRELEVAVDSFSDIVLLMDCSGNILRGNRAVENWNIGKVTGLEGLHFHKLFHPHCFINNCHMNSYWTVAVEKIKEDQCFEYQINDNILKRYLLIQYQPISSFARRNADTRNVFAIASFKDITVRKQAEIQLNQATAELESIFQVLPDQYIRLNKDGTVLALKAGMSSNVSIFTGGAIGENIRTIFPSSIADKFFNAMQEVLITNSLVRLEYFLGSKNNAHYFEARFLPLMEDQIIMVNQDITEKKKLEAIAESVDMMKNLGYIFSAIRHEIGNPVNAIKMTMSVLKKNIGKFPIEKIVEYTDRVLSEVNRVEYLLKSFKSFNIFEDLNIVSIRIGDFLLNFFSLLNEDLKQKDIRVDLKNISETDIVYADPRALHQVLLNIIGNAVDALKEKDEKWIELSTKKGNGRVWIEIRDNGQGFSENQLKNLFKPFFTTKEEGSGLGLVIVKKILTRMNGEIEIESTENVGTTVNIILKGETGENF